MDKVSPGGTPSANPPGLCDMSADFTFALIAIKEVIRKQRMAFLIQFSGIESS
jgi:hypothetical protein